MSLFSSKNRIVRFVVAANFSLRPRAQAIASGDPPRRKACGYQKRPFESHSPSGFTLIEILVSLAILSVVLTAIYSTFFLSHRAIEGMDESMIQLQESRSALDILKRELDSALYDVRDEKTLFKILDSDIYGRQAVELSFATFSPVRPGLSRITYSVEDKDGILYLLKKVESPYGKTDVTGEPIIEGIEGFTVEAKYGDQWVRTWDTDVNKGIPHEIRITLSLVIKGRKTEISDIAKPKIGRQV